MAFNAGCWYANQSATENGSPGGIKLSQVTFSQPFIVPASDEPVEVVLTLRPSTEQPGRDLARRHEFVIYSFLDGEDVIEHCRGFTTILSGETMSSDALLHSPRRRGDFVN